MFVLLKTKIQSNRPYWFCVIEMREKLEESEPNWPARNRTKHALYYVTRDLTYSSKAYATTFHNFLKQTSCDQKKKEKMYFPLRKWRMKCTS